MNDQNRNRLQSFASLRWYDETIRFIFNFVTKTSELLLAAGVVVSTANFLIDGGVMGHNQVLSDAWSWAQALAIDSSLGIVFTNAFQAVREREKAKAVIFFTLTALLATVAGLITHFDAFAHAAGLPVTDRSVSGVIPLWIMTALRAIAVIGFLLASRLKHVSFQQLRQEWSKVSEQEQDSPREPIATAQIDYQSLAASLVEAMQQAGTIGQVNVVEQGTTALPARKESAPSGYQEVGSVDAKLARMYTVLREERATQQNEKPISARELAGRAKIRRSTCSDWLRQYGAYQMVGAKRSHPESAFSEQEDGTEQEPSGQNKRLHAVGTDDQITSFSSKE